MAIETLQNETRSEVETRQKILDAAEVLFARDGFKATSLRTITSQAGVNVAAVNYYFRSKDQLIVELLSRAIRPLNQQRLELLDRVLHASHPAPGPVPAILEAMIRPCLEISFDPKREQIFLLLGRSISEEGNLIKEIVQKEWTPIATRFVQALQAALPKSSQEELFLKVHFIIGTLIHTACHRDDLHLLTGKKVSLSFEEVLKRLIQFCSAGLSNTH
jgi:AcrR family transcriptional regulator